MNFQNASIETVRRFWDDRPCNLMHSRREPGSREYFDEVERRRYFVEPHIPGFAAFGRWAGKRVLEVGCGIGTDTISFARAGARVIAVDLSERSLDVARRHAEVYGVEVGFYAADAERLSDTLPLEPYDLVYSFGALHHTPHPERALTQIRPYLSPTGTLKLMMYHRRSWKVLAITRGRFWDQKLIARHSEAQTGCPVTYTFTRRSLAALLTQCGFRPERFDVEHIFPWRVADYVEYRYVKEWYWRYLPAAVFHAIERRLGWHLCATAVAC